MISYQDYLLIVGRLSRLPMARIQLGSREILIEKSFRGWKLSTQIFEAEGAIPEHVKECVWGAALLKWREKISLTLDPLTDSVHLIQEVEPSQYLTFRSQISQFLTLADEWEEIVAGFATDQANNL